MRTTVGSSRRVGVCAARKRATPTRISADSSEPSGHAVAWRTPASTVWNQWKPASSTSSACPSAAIELGARTARLQEPVRLVRGFVDHALRVEAAVQRVDAARRGLRQPRRGNVEEAVEVDAQRGVHRGAPQLGRGVAAQRLVQRVGGGERVVHGVPVGVVVARVEAHDAQRGRVRDRAPELLVGRARRPARRRARRRRRRGSSASSCHATAPTSTCARRRRRRRLPAAAPIVSAASATRSCGWRHSENSSERCAPRRLARRASGSTCAAASAPSRSSASNALFVKSIVWPPSMNTWSVTAANIIASTAARCAGSRQRGLAACARRSRSSGCR